MKMMMKIMMVAVIMMMMMIAMIGYALAFVFFLNVSVEETRDSG